MTAIRDSPKTRLSTNISECQWALILNTLCEDEGKRLSQMKLIRTTILLQSQCPMCFCSLFSFLSVSVRECFVFPIPLNYSCDSAVISIGFGAVENCCALMLIGLDLMTHYFAEDGLQLSFMTWTGLIIAILREAVVQLVSQFTFVCSFSVGPQQ